MATLSTGQRKAVGDVIMERFSAVRDDVPLTKSQFRAIIDAADDALEGADTATIQAFNPNSDERNWLVGTPKAGRHILELVAEARRKLL